MINLAWYNNNINYSSIPSLTMCENLFYCIGDEELNLHHLIKTDPNVSICIEELFVVDSILIETFHMVPCHIE